MAELVERLAAAATAALRSQAARLQPEPGLLRRVDPATARRYRQRSGE